MGTLLSLSRSATVISWYVSVLAAFVFGVVFLCSWFLEEFATTEKWKRRRTLLLRLAIIGVIGEQIGTIAEFAFSEHLQTIDEARISELTAAVNLSFTAEQVSALASCFIGAHKGVVYVASKAFDDRSARYAQRLKTIFASAGFDARDQPPDSPALLSMGGTGFALFVRNPTVPPAHAVPISKCFKAAHINLGIGRFNKAIQWLNADDVMVGVSAP